MSEFVSLRLHAYLKFTQGIKVFQDTEQHHDKMRIAVKTLYISLASLCFTTDLKNFIFIKHLYYLTIDRLSGKMTIFAHGYIFI
mgnify:CR=1 FL=1